ncbi:MAG: hypothetical protein CL908_03655 [Deltaproteobacteria bacterium]|nr:hypothetical protein [Deltaproteobacteria bacterium]
MGAGFAISLVFAGVCAFASILLGRNLTRSLVAAYVFIGALGVALLFAGAGFMAFVIGILGALMLAALQLFGWMLVDVDRDHLPATDRPTWLARSLAFLLVGLALALLVAGALAGGELATAAGRPATRDPMAIGRLLFGPLGDVTMLVGLAVAAGLLASLLLLRDDGRA